MSYEWMKSGLEDETDTDFSGPDSAAGRRRNNCTACSPIWKRRSTRAAISGPAPKKPKMVDNLRAVLTRPGFTEAEIKVLRGIVSSLDYFSPGMPRGEGRPAMTRRRLPCRRAQTPGRQRRLEIAKLGTG